MGPSKATDAVDYKNTLNLPKTDFPMRGSLPKREPGQVEQWLQKRIYHRMVERSRSRKIGRYILHDGPPYANGDIHLGHVLNKVLKDIVIKYKNMCGFESPYIPGWDCHGLPIELGVEKQLRAGKKKRSDCSIVEFRQMCREYAQKYVQLQMVQFQRLEVFGDWEKSYTTMSKEYVSSIVRELGKISDAGLLQRGNKAILWCPSCTTALAEAEIEYEDKKSPSIYVKFELGNEALQSFGELAEVVKKAGAKTASVVIWTTTPWTIPSNLAIALHPDFGYLALEVRPDSGGKEVWIIAKDLREAFEQATGLAGRTEALLEFGANRLHRKNARHPFVDRDSLIILGEHVTLEAGTGAVHTAPGHGPDDFIIGKKYGLEPFSPVDHRGRFTHEFAPMEGQFVFDANKPVIDLLRKSGHLIAHKEIMHSYPHCWRCHKPVIFRATPQWFIGVQGGGKNSLRKKALEAIDQVNWIPDWGVKRIQGMVESRPDWCISRQRSWGVPITVFYCESCDEAKADSGVFSNIADQIEKKGVDVWFTESVDQLLPPGASCNKCGGQKFRKESDILDVWFDSGVSHAAVCENSDLGWPVDLYLEGSDQHRGWFQTSLLTAVATRNRAPFKSVLTHGFIMDKNGRKMSKSKGNVVSPSDLMKNDGADTLRLWVVLEDYQSDSNFSRESMARVSESYRRIRNTLRFLLGNIGDFDPATDEVDQGKMGSLDRWALSRVGTAMKRITQAYDRFEFHTVYHQLVNLCSVDLSAIYFDILKDRLYTAKSDSLERRSSQTAMWRILDTLVRTITPILSYTAEESWSHMSDGQKPEESRDSVFLADYPDQNAGNRLNPVDWIDPQLEKEYSESWRIRDLILKVLEDSRNEGRIGHSREARVILTVPENTISLMEGLGEDPSRLFMVSQIEILAGEENVEIQKADGEKCARCWVYRTSVGQDSEHSGICSSCVEAIR